MNFEFNTAENLQIKDLEISDLLTQVYVGGGFTEPDDAKTLFNPESVRERGLLIGARNSETSELAGMIILVPSDSKARRLAENNEAEIHLLGVKEKYRGKGVGRYLVEQTISIAKNKGYSKILLWTQKNMKAARDLYQSVGFSRVKSFEKNKREFLVYSLNLEPGRRIKTTAN